ncbi:chemotaxis protein MotC [Salinarimonas chemoclinalis]|uniref:chemotaxis protein MotC n=1 Tax=Salinarimonas chemoclinalis TaxID=3241599 RepID=UPI003555F13E
MIRPSFRLPLALACLLAAAPASAQPDPPVPTVETPAAPAAVPEPYALVRTLQALQERVAHGDVEAHRAQRALIGRIALGFEAAPPSAWADARNARAAIAFVLGGGPPQSLEAILASGAEFGAPRTLAQGALAFLQGREVEAREAWREADPLTVGGMLGGQLALAQSALAVREDPAEAMRLLAVARLLAPGTLIEEAALRREVFVAGQSGEVERLEFLAIQYLRRFRHSIYAGNFRQRFATLLTALDFHGDLDRFGRLEAMLERFDGESRRDLYLFFARHSLVHGRPEVARRAATLAHGLAAGDSDAEWRATFYAAASQVTTDRFALAAETLADVDPARLPAPDVALLETVIDLAVQVGAPIPIAEEPPTDVIEDLVEAVADGETPEVETPVADFPADAAPDVPAPDDPAFAPPEATPAMRRAEAALAAIDALLTEARR